MACNGIDQNTGSGFCLKGRIGRFSTSESIHPAHAHAPAPLTKRDDAKLNEWYMIAVAENR